MTAKISFSEVDQKWMQRAIVLAQKGRCHVSPNPMVGAVITRGNKMIAEGWHKRHGSEHAEIDALKKIRHQAQAATLYVNLEPCFHEGKTPPCVKALIAAGVKRVVVGMRDPNPLTCGRSIKLLRKNGIEVLVGCLRQESQKLNEAFIYRQTYARPFVVSKSAQTLDGKIATVKGNSKWITSNDARLWSRKKRDEFDAILVGVNTILKDDSKLTPWRKKRHFYRLIVDPHLKLQSQAQCLSLARPEELIVITGYDMISSVRYKRLVSAGYHVLTGEKDRNGKILFENVLQDLAETFHIQSLLIEGGAVTIGEFLRQGYINKMHFYLAYKIMGDQSALSSVQGLSPKEMGDAVSLIPDQFQPLKSEMFISAYVHRNH